MGILAPIFDCGCGCKGKPQEKKFMISLMSALIFFIVANPDTFRLMRRILGSWVSGATGCPTTAGLILHTVVFMLVTWGIMNVKKESYEMGVSTIAPAAAPTPMMKEEKVIPPSMAKMPAPLPGMMEGSLDLTDSGIDFAPLDINTEMDLPAPMMKSNDDGAVSCACTNGKKVVIT